MHTGNSAKPSVPNTTETQGVNFRQIIQESKNEELVQQKEREARSQNFIIHGFSESPETQEGNDEDCNTIGELLGIIEVEAIPESITRLGKRHETNSRPIKVKMTSLNEKQMVMSSLAKLTNATAEFKKISITDDYTFGERQTIKNKVTEARNKAESEGEGNYIWRVRGGPKNGLRLVRFTKIKP